MALDESEIDDEEVRRRRQWRHLRTAITLLALVIFVVVAAWFSWRQVTGSDDRAEPQGNTSCAPTATGAAPAPQDIQLNVYNATSREGLASSVADELRARGFSVVEVDNDPLDKTIDGTAEVRAHLDQQAVAAYVATLVPGAVFVPDQRTSASVDLVLGATFDALTAADAPAAPVATLSPCAAPAS